MRAAFPVLLEKALKGKFKFGFDFYSFLEEPSVAEEKQFYLCLVLFLVFGSENEFFVLCLTKKT